MLVCSPALGPPHPGVARHSLFAGPAQRAFLELIASQQEPHSPPWAPSHNPSSSLLTREELTVFPLPKSNMGGGLDVRSRLYW